MYLLMLLATFVSAIYGFNLSARSDYDRDVAKKKAMGVVYKFLFQEKNAVSLLSRVGSGMYHNETYNLSWTLPGDRIYADFSSSAVDDKNKDTTLFYEQSSPTLDVKPFYLRKMKSVENVNQTGFQAQSSDYLEVGRRFFDGSEMVTKALCLTEELQKPNATMCEPTPIKDASDNVIGYTGTCCNTSHNYVVTYKQLDSRWVHRIHKGISLDFMNSIVDRDYNNNIGVIHWDGNKQCKGTEGSENRGCWVFQGKISFQPVYAEEMEQWENENINPETGIKPTYPLFMRQRGTWDLPKNIFPEDFFTNKDGQNICELGCLFKIRMF